MNLALVDKIRRGISDIVSLIYPNVCQCCLEESIEKGGNIFCLTCHAQFPYTRDIHKIDNDLMYHFYGRVPIVRATALMWYSEGGIVQQMIHRMKYKHVPEIADQLGKMLGKSIFENNFGENIDMCVPVPMHIKKQRLRGFNQATLIADAVSNETNIKSEHSILIKSKETVTQTNKNRKERQINTFDNYEVINKVKLKDKHILIIDDVVTTGSTIEACAVQLLNNGASKISVACLAMGNRFF